MADVPALGVCVMELDIDEAIVTLIKERPNLYVVSRNDYRNTGKRENSFDEIGRELNMKGEEVQAHWKRIRDRYTREKRKLKRKSGSSPEKTSKWELYYQMQFIDDYIVPRSMPGNLSTPAETQDMSEEFLPWPSTSNDENGHNSDTNQDRSTIPASSCTIGATCKRRREDDSSNIENTLNAIGTAVRSAILNDQCNDEEDLYCASLAKCLKRLSPRKKSLAKMRIQQLMYEIEFSEPL